jgi:hypothetical protein
MNSALRQIGNAVPPLLAQAIGQTLLKLLKGEEQAELTKDLVESGRQVGKDWERSDKSQTVPFSGTCLT